MVGTPNNYRAVTRIKNSANVAERGGISGGIKVVIAKLGLTTESEADMEIVAAIGSKGMVLRLADRSVAFDGSRNALFRSSLK